MADLGEFIKVESMLTMIMLAKINMLLVNIGTDILSGPIG